MRSLGIASEIVFLAGCFAIVMGGILWFLGRSIPEEMCALARLPYREAVRQLGLEGIRLRPLRDWDKRAQLQLLGQAKVSRLWRTMLLVGVFLAGGGLLVEAATHFLKS